MASYDLTVIYASHISQPDISPDFPFSSSHGLSLQIIPVCEDDLYDPRKNSLQLIEQAEGRFTIMLDAGDEFTSENLKVLISETDDPAIAFSMPVLSFCMKSSASVKDPTDLVIDSRENHYAFPPDLHGVMIATDRLKAAARKIKWPREQEKQIILALLDETPVYKFLRTQIVRFITPKERNYNYDMRCHDRAWYYEPLEQFLIPMLEEKEAQGGVDPFRQMMALYMLNARINPNVDNKNKHVLSTEEVPAYMELFKKVIRHVSTSILLDTLSDTNSTKTTSQRILFYMRLKKNDFSYYPDLVCGPDSAEFMIDGLSLGDLYTRMTLRLTQLDYANGHLEIDAAYFDFISNEHAQVFASFGGKKYPLNYNKRYSMTKYFGVTAIRQKTFHVSIPVEESTKDRVLNFVVCASGKEYVMDYSFPVFGSRFAKDFGYAYWLFADYMAYWQPNGIHVIKAEKKKIFRKEVALWLQMWKRRDGFYRRQLPSKIINFFLQPYFKKQKIWLFHDKIYKGADSSEYIYRYAEKKDDGIKKYYLLDKTSTDYKRMKKEGYKPLKRGTLKHRLIFLNADMVIASNSTVFAFNGYSFKHSLPIRANVHFDVACVQHGMSVQKIAIAQQRLRDNTRLYFCASKYEIENLSKPVYDYIGYDALKLTGVPRYDGLKSRPKKNIVISPTWRMQSALPVQKSESFARDYNPNFKESEYYKVYNSLINDPRLLEASRKYGYHIQYVLHPIISPQSEDFEKNDVVEIIPSIGDMSYEKIFCEGALMVSDFSGVQFDFAYMRKPVVYLHHNDIPQHYEEGTFHYKTMGFGEICHTNDELIDVLCEYMKNDCVMPEIYRKRADDFFEFSDNNNCERIYPIMLEHTMNRK